MVVCDKSRSWQPYTGVDSRNEERHENVYPMMWTIWKKSVLLIIALSISVVAIPVSAVVFIEIIGKVYIVFLSFAQVGSFP